MRLPDNSDTACLIKADWLDDHDQADDAQKLREEVAEGPNIGDIGSIGSCSLSIGGGSVFGLGFHGIGGRIGAYDIGGLGVIGFGGVGGTVGGGSGVVGIDIGGGLGGDGIGDVGHDPG